WITSVVFGALVAIQGVGCNRGGPVLTGTRPGHPMAAEQTIVSTDAHTCALLVDTTVRCWGWNAQGELGDGTYIDRSRPTAVAGLTGVRQVAVGHTDSCAVMNEGSVRCWGANDFCQLGTDVASRSPGTFSSPT